MPDFETRVLTQLDSINNRLGNIELRVSGVDGDPNNKGIFGKLAEVDNDIGVLRSDQRMVVDDQLKQRAWLKGMAAGLLVTGGTGIVTLARMLGAG